MLPIVHPAVVVGQIGGSHEAFVGEGCDRRARGDRRLRDGRPPVPRSRPCDRRRGTGKPAPDPISDCSARHPQGGPRTTGRGRPTRADAAPGPSRRHPRRSRGQRPPRPHPQDSSHLRAYAHPRASRAHTAAARGSPAASRSSARAHAYPDADTDSSPGTCANAATYPRSYPGCTSHITGTGTDTDPDRTCSDAGCAAGHSGGAADRDAAHSLTPTVRRREV